MLSIIVSWKNRVELKQSITSLLQTASRLKGEVIIVNFDGDVNLLNKMLRDIHSKYLRVIHVKNQSQFNKAATNNIGASCASFKYLFFCDCDIILEPESVETLLNQVSSSPKYFGTLKGVTETVINSINNNNIISFGYELIIKTKDGRQLNIIDSEEDATDGSRNAPGLLLTSKANFEDVNGYNGRLVGWGWEDQDMIGRLTLGAGLERIQFGRALHISHSDEDRIKHYPNPNRWESRDKMFRQAISNYDAEDFSGTFKNDIEKYQFG